MVLLNMKVSELALERFSGCGEGWRPIIQEALEKINEMNPNTEILQIKEKFGGLRLYVGHIDGSDSMEIEKIVRHAEKECGLTCEYCGCTGRWRKLNWQKTLCDLCYYKALVKELNQNIQFIKFSHGREMKEEKKKAYDKGFEDGKREAIRDDFTTE